MGQVFGISNPYLVSALGKAAQRQDVETRETLYTALLESTLIVLTVEEFGESLLPERQVLTSGQALKLITIENEAGDQLLVAFTDAEAVLAWIPEGASYLALGAPALFALALNNDIAGVIINPAGPVVGRVLRPEFLALAQGKLPFDSSLTSIPAIADSETLLVSRPADLPPVAWLDGIRAILEEQKDFSRAYLFQLQHGKVTAPFVIGLCLTDEVDVAQQETLMQDFIAACEQILPENHGLSFVVLSEDMFLRTVRDTVEPLYECT